MAVSGGQRDVQVYDSERPDLHNAGHLGTRGKDRAWPGFTLGAAGVGSLESNIKRHGLPSHVSNSNSYYGTSTSHANHLPGSDMFLFTPRGLDPAVTGGAVPEAKM